MIIKTDPEIIQRYFEDSSGMTGAHAERVAIVQSKKDVSDLLAKSFETKTPVTVAGGTTGVTGGCLAFGGTVLSTEQLNAVGKIEQISETKAVVKVGAGAFVNEIKNYVLQNGWMYPPDPTEKNATIGGNISTNASGGRGFKYGATRDYINALEIVFSDGSSSYIKRGGIFADDTGKIIIPADTGNKKFKLPDYKLPDVKNATGYFNRKNADAVDVFIGSEGTLAVIVSAELILIRPFEMMFGGIIFFEDRKQSWNFVKEVREISQNNALDDEINAMSIEYFDKNALELIKKDYPVIPDSADAGILFEQDCKKTNYDLLLEKWISIIEKYGIDTNRVWFASDVKQQEEFRKFRHKIPERVNEIVKKHKIPKVGTDIAVPHEKLEEMIYFCENKFNEAGLTHLTFGHIGESHLHANLIAKSAQEYETCRSIYLEIAKKAVELGGTVSAEHGIGKTKHPFAETMFGRRGIEEMRQLKLTLDPANILGQNNIFNYSDQ